VFPIVLYIKSCSMGQIEAGGYMIRGFTSAKIFESSSVGLGVMNTSGGVMLNLTLSFSFRAILFAYYR